MVIHRALVSALLLAAAGCSHAAHPPPADLSVAEGGPPNPQPMGGGVNHSGGDGGGLDGASADGSTLACNTLNFDNAMVIPRAAVADVFPLPMGGPLAEGSYAATKYEVYTGSGGAVQTSGSFQGVLVLAGGVAQLYFLFNGALVERRTAAYSTLTSTLTLTDTCPDTKATADGYSVVNGNAIAFFFTQTKEVITFTKQ